MDDGWTCYSDDSRESVNSLTSFLIDSPFINYIETAVVRKARYITP